MPASHPQPHNPDAGNTGGELPRLPPIPDTEWTVTPPPMGHHRGGDVDTNNPLAQAALPHHRPTTTQQPEGHHYPAGDSWTLTAMVVSTIAAIGGGVVYFTNAPKESLPPVPQKPETSLPQKSSPLPASPPNPSTPIAPRTQGASMNLVKSGRTNHLGNPILSLQLFEQGKFVGAFDAVSGRADTQTADRLQSGTLAPLPPGEYSIAAHAIASDLPQIGKGADGVRWFIGIQSPTQGTRQALGIHIDPSFDKNDGEDGTHGCIGLTNTRDGDAVRRWIELQRPTVLAVRY